MPRKGGGTARPLTELGDDRVKLQAGPNWG